MVLNKINEALHYNLKSEKLLGVKVSEANSYYEQIKPIADSKPPIDMSILTSPQGMKGRFNTFLPDGQKK